MPDESKVLQFKKKKPDEVWECECGCQLFYALGSYELECRDCKKVSHTIFTTLEPPKE